MECCINSFPCNRCVSRSCCRGNNNGRIQVQKLEALAANERIEELRNENRELKKRVEPRKLNWNSFVEILRSARRVRLEIMYVADDNDSMQLAQQIQQAASATGWEEPSRNPIERPNGWSESLAMSVDGQPTGVTVVAAFGTPTDKVEGAIQAGLGSVATHIGGAHAPPPGVIRIVVAPKPSL